MRASLFIENIKIGTVQLEIVDIFMGVLSGRLHSNSNYDNFKDKIMNQCDERGISNITDFNYKLILENGYELTPEGGIGIIHFREFIDEISVETAGNDIENIKKQS